MEDGTLDCSQYNLADLEEALSSINERKFPLNYERLKKELAHRKANPPPPEPLPPNEPPKPYVPNHIPEGERLQLMVICLLLVAYGAIGLYYGDIYVPRKLGWGSAGTHFHGDAALLMYGAIISAVFGALSVVVDHYDERNNEEMYLGIASLFYVTAFGLYIAAFVANMN
jgi:hypothetical protein